MSLNIMQSQLTPLMTPPTTEVMFIRNLISSILPFHRTFTRWSLPTVNYGTARHSLRQIFLSCLVAAFAEMRCRRFAPLERRSLDRALFGTARRRRSCALVGDDDDGFVRICKTAILPTLPTCFMDCYLIISEATSRSRTSIHAFLETSHCIVIAKFCIADITNSSTYSLH